MLFLAFYPIALVLLFYTLTLLYRCFSKYCSLLVPSQRHSISHIGAVLHGCRCDYLPQV